MGLVIETNISFKEDGTMADFQSRIIEVENWDIYVEEIKNKKSINRSAYIGGMYGCSLPRVCKVSNIIHDEFHLSYDIEIYNGRKTKKLAYLIR